MRQLLILSEIHIEVSGQGLDARLQKLYKRIAPDRLQ